MNTKIPSNIGARFNVKVSDYPFTYTCYRRKNLTNQAERWGATLIQFVINRTQNFSFITFK